MQQPVKKKKDIKGALKESTWITAAWSWFTTLVSRAAEGILLACVVYSVIAVFPGVPHFPPAVDVVVEVIQVVTQDIAGIGLMKLAKRLHLGDNSKPYTIGRALIYLMFASLVVAIGKRLLNVPDTAPWLLGLEGILLLFRAFYAVNYGPVIHEINDMLKEREDEKTIDEQVQERLSKAVEQEIKALTDRFAEIQKSVQPLAVLPAKLTEIESIHTLSIAKIERHIETLTPFNVEEIEKHTDAKLKAFSLSISDELKGQIERESLSIERQNSEKLKGIQTEIERQLKGWIERQTVTVSEVPPSSTPKKAPIPIAARAKATSQPTPPQGKREFVFRCLEDDANMSIADIQKRADEAGLKLSTGTVSKYRQAFNSGETESKNERDAESEDDEIESAG